MIFSDPVDQNPKGHLPGIFIVTMLWKLATKENTDLDPGTVANMLPLTYETRHLMRINAGDPRQRTYFWWIWKTDPGTYDPRPPPKSLKKGELRTYGIWASTQKLPSRLSFGRGQNVEHVGFKISFGRNGRMNEMAELGLEDGTEGRRDEEEEDLATTGSHLPSNGADTQNLE